MYVDKTEYKKLEDLESSIDVVWNMISEIRSNGNSKSCIIGHDVNGELSTIETYLKSAAQKTQKLRLAYEKELKNKNGVLNMINEYKNEDKKCECWKCELKDKCNFKDKYQRLPRTSSGALGLCKKL